MEGELKEVNEEEQPSSGTYKVVFWQAHG